MANNQSSGSHRPGDRSMEDPAISSTIRSEPAKKARKDGSNCIKDRRSRKTILRNPNGVAQETLRMIMKKPYPFRGELQLGVTDQAEREYTHFQRLQAAAFRDRTTVASPSRPGRTFPTHSAVLA